MNLFNFFNREKTTEKKPKTTFRLSELLDYFQTRGWYTVTASASMTLYNKNSALSDAIDTISSELKSIQPTVRINNKEYNNDHEVVKLLNNPNPKQDYGQFIESLFIYKSLTGNAFLTALGNIKYIPTELHITPSTAVFAIGSGDNYEMNVNCPNALLYLNNKYKYDKKQGRYISDLVTEFVHLSRFINYTTTDGYIADSILSSICYELEVLNNGNNHNLGLLLNGVNLSGVFSLDTLDNKVVEQFKIDVKNYFGGSGNAGKYLVSQGKSVEFKPITMSNKDMQQVENLDQSRKVIYDRFQIPSPMRNGDATTYNNYGTAQIVLYDKAVLPHLNDIFRTLTLFFRKRKALKDNEVLTYDPTSIPALQERFNAQIKLKKEIGVFTTNELRKDFNAEPKGIENDILYQPAGLVPVGMSLYESNDMEDDTEDETEDSEAKKRFISILKKKGLSDSEIKEKVKKIYANT